MVMFGVGWQRPSWTRPFIQEPGLKDKPSRSWLTVFLCLISIAGATIQATTALHTTWLFAPTAIWILAFVYVVLVRLQTFSFLCLLAYCAILICEVVVVQGRWHDPVLVAPIALSVVAIVALINAPLSWKSREDISPTFSIPTRDLRSPEDDLTFWQWMTVSWVWPLMKVGNQRQLHDEDVWSLPYEFQHRHLHDAFRQLKGSVIRRLLRANWMDLALLTVLELFELTGTYAQPVLLQILLKSMEEIQFHKRPAIETALLILTVRFAVAQSEIFSLWFGRRCYERSRGEMITMVYEKTLCRKAVGMKDVTEKSSTDETALLSSKPPTDETTPLLPKSTAETTPKPSTRWQNLKAYFRKKPDEQEAASMGKILNLLRNDVYEVSQRFWDYQQLIDKPLGLIYSLALTWRLLGWSCLLGVAVVVVAQILNAVLARILLSWERTRRKATDVRLQQTSQYIEAIRHLRWYAWQFSWLSRIMTARQRELNLKIITYLWNILISTINSLASGTLPVASFYAYTALSGRPLTVDVAFPALELFFMLQQNLQDLPDLIRTFLNATVAMGRIEDFMKEPEKLEVDEDVDHLEVNGSFSWPGLERLVLRDMSLTFPPGLTIVAGEVASGKTALLQALLGELDLQAGSLHRPPVPMAYCAQTPWLQSMTIRDNILFSTPYDERRYKQTLDVCALIPDLATFKQGDLSGGQKARVALARAIYSHAPYLLLDDPLSALDQQTAELIARKCIQGHLTAGKVVVLATHRIDLFHEYAQFIQMTDGTASIVKHARPVHHVEADEVATEPVMTELLESAVPDQFEEEEYRVHGGVQLAVYWEYIKAGKLKWWALIILTSIIHRGLNVSQSWFLKEWGEAYQQEELGRAMNNTVGQTFETAISTLKFGDQSPSTFDSLSILNLTVARFGAGAIPMLKSETDGSSSTFESGNALILTSPISKLFDRFPNPGVNVNPWLIGFFLIIVGQNLATLISRIVMLVVNYTAGKNMFIAVMNRVSNTTFRYYDITPIGRLMNRLTSDIGTIDGNISQQFLNVTILAISWVAQAVVVASITPTFLAFSFLLMFTFVYIFLQYLPPSQSLRRLEMVSLSPLMSNFGALLNGLTTVRAFRAQPQFQNRVIAVTDAFQKMDHFYWSVQAWLMYRFDLLSGFSTFLVTLLAIYSGLSAGLTAFVLVAAGKLVNSTHSLCRQYGALQLNFVSVERVVELLHLDQEETGASPPAWWPSFGSDVVLENVSIRYAPHLDLALDAVSLTLKGGTNTAIVGRTGSGKSTLAAALLATVPYTGRILIDGVEIGQTDKQALRSRVTFLAQDPVLFQGTLRHNLDPNTESTDDECLAVLARFKYGWTLDFEVDAGGRNLSQGQRQLIGLARAMLRRSSIVIMDEATASIDLETSWEIQRVLREEMKGSTVITIAHRTSVVRDADWAVVLAGGKVVKQGRPEELDLQEGEV